jgi:hypothetical protein
MVCTRGRKEKGGFTTIKYQYFFVLGENQWFKICIFIIIIIIEIVRSLIADER